MPNPNGPNGPNINERDFYQVSLPAYESQKNYSNGAIINNSSVTETDSDLPAFQSQTSPTYASKMASPRWVDPQSFLDNVNTRYLL